jgi:NTE family protein
MPMHGLVWLLLSVVACGYPVNPRLPRAHDPRTTYRYANVAAGAGNTDEVLVILTFSGGGTRAAALAFGALQGLRATQLAGGRTLLDEVDVISSVSGGSFAAAYLGLFGQERFFARFRSEVLSRRLEWGIVLDLLKPWNALRLLSPHYARSDVADAYYGRVLFEERTFARMPRTRPFIVLNATDISQGAQFSFTQEHFDRLCSDLDGVAVSRGVTASSAFPVAFTPLTLANYPKDTCDYETPGWIPPAESDDQWLFPPQRELARTWRSYEDATARPFVHLSDGGLADNIGLRAAWIAMTLDGDDPWHFTADVNARTVKHVVIVAVDAKPRGVNRLDGSPRPPSVYSVLNAAATNPMENYSSDTVELFRRWFEQWDIDAAEFQAKRDNCARLAQDRCHRAGERCESVERARCEGFVAPPSLQPVHPKLHLVHVRFDTIPDDDVKSALQNVDTRLQLPPRSVDMLVEWGCRLLDHSEAYAGLLATLHATKAACPAPAAR